MTAEYAGGAPAETSGCFAAPSHTPAKWIDYAAMLQSSDSDTIAAIATAPGAAAIGIVRLSGPAALAIADKIFRASPLLPSAASHLPPPTSHLLLPSVRPANTFHHGYVVDADGVVVDDVLMLLFRAPHSYSGEDAVEFQGHGGVIATRQVLRAALDAGARSAQPGEFTKRAFLNGRLDLVQAEAVLDLINARSEAAAGAAREQLDGILSRALAELYDGAMNLAADLEATLDFSEDELPETVLAAIPQRLQTVIAAAERLLAGWHEGRILREGALVVIAGPPNAGKSTLFNRILGHERTIVHQQPGTTRDLVEEALVLQGLPIRLVDTAGLRETAHEVENEGIRRARASLQDADLVLYVVDAGVGISAEDRAVMAAMPSGKVIVILNKHDLINSLQGHDGDSPQGDGPRDLASHLACSAKTGWGLDALKAMILAQLQADPGRLSHAAISERHARLLQTAITELTSTKNVMTATPDQAAFASDHLRAAIESLGEITGRTYHTELLDAVFSRFCIGK